MAVPKEYKVLGGGKGGSFAMVYKVRHKKLGHVRAIRELKDHIVANNEEELEKDDIYKKFLRETQTLLKLGNGSHPNIENISSFGTFQDPDCPSEHIAYWERNYIQGDNLEEYLKQNSYFVPVEEVILMAEQISSALAYCHEDAYCFLMDPAKDKLPDGCIVGSIVEDSEIRRRLIDDNKVIHNDIHLKNILRRIDRNYLLIDFGMAVEGNEVPTLSRCHGGAEISRAPELWNSDSSVRPTTQTDVYSLGVVLYAFLAGQYPFSYNDEKLGYAHLHIAPPPIKPIREKFYKKRFPGQTYKRDYQPWLEDAIMKCLEKDPAKRFRNGKELYEFIKIHCQDDNNAKYEMEIGQLTSENEILNSQVNDLRNSNVSINKQLNSKQNALNRSQQSLHDTQDRLEKLQHKFNKSRAPLWILLTLFGLLLVAVSLYSWNNRPTEWKKQLEEKDQAIASANNEIAELQAMITDLQNGESHPAPNKNESEEITRLTNLIAEKDQKIRDLENQLTNQKPKENSSEITRLNNIVKQKDQRIQELESSTKDKNNRLKQLETQLSNQKTSDNSAELKRLNNEVTRLNNSIKQKDQKIQNLESTVKDKDKEIKVLNGVIAGKNPR